jgi:NitT/TauT family transport system substrate-binding protein
MHIQHARPFSRRKFLGGLTLVGTAGLLGVRPRSAAAEPPPETARIRLVDVPLLCSRHSILRKSYCAQKVSPESNM